MPLQMHKKQYADVLQQKKAPRDAKPKKGEPESSASNRTQTTLAAYCTRKETEKYPLDSLRYFS